MKVCLGIKKKRACFYKTDLDTIKHVCSVVNNSNKSNPPNPKMAPKQTFFWEFLQVLSSELDSKGFYRNTITRQCALCSSPLEQWLSAKRLITFCLCFVIFQVFGISTHMCEGLIETNNYGHNRLNNNNNCHVQRQLSVLRHIILSIRSSQICIDVNFEIKRQNNSWLLYWWWS